MSKYTDATAVVPMPAAMAGLTGDFASVRAVLAGLGMDLATGGTFVDTPGAVRYTAVFGAPAPLTPRPAAPPYLFPWGPQPAPLSVTRRWFVPYGRKLPPA